MIAWRTRFNIHHVKCVWWMNDDPIWTSSDPLGITQRWHNDAMYKVVGREKKLFLSLDRWVSFNVGSIRNSGFLSSFISLPIEFRGPWASFHIILSRYLSAQAGSVSDKFLFYQKSGFLKIFSRTKWAIVDFIGIHFIRQMPNPQIFLR